MREIGKVDWFEERKGYGFILDDKGIKVFVHYTAIEGNDLLQPVNENREYKTLEENQRVEFTRVEGPKGPTAQKVKVL